LQNTVKNLIALVGQIGFFLCGWSIDFQRQEEGVGSIGLCRVAILKGKEEGKKKEDSKSYCERSRS